MDKKAVETLKENKNVDSAFQFTQFTNISGI